ncbi:hypothetical protein KCU95_g14581, partial [Aureobasidium melanogenum]
MAGIRMPHLPNEILYEIAGYVDDKDILNLRLSAKVFQYVTADRFATAFFQDRAYELSPKGLTALVKITEHSVFAPHIRTVIIGHGVKHSSAKYHGLLEQAFQNLASIGNTISLGLRRVRTSHNYQHKVHCGGHQMWRFWRDKMLPAASHAQMPVGNIVADVQTASQNRLLPSDSQYWSQDFIDVLLAGALGNGLTRDYQIKLGAGGSDSSKSSFIRVGLQGKRLEGLRVCTWDSYNYLTYGLMLQLREIDLDDCVTNYNWLAELLRTTCSRQLEHLSLYNVRLRQRTGNSYRSRTWLKLFKSLKSPTVLKSCKFGRLWSDSGDLWLEGGKKPSKPVPELKSLLSSQTSPLVSALPNSMVDGGP